MSPVQCLNPVQSEVMDIRKLKSEFGAELAFWGGIGTQRVLPLYRPEQIRSEVLRIVEIMSPGGGYILGPSQGIQADVPLENVLALIETARELG